MFAELLQSCRERYGSSDSTVSLANWLTENTTINNKPFGYSQYPFQRAIADDEHPNLACEKCSQVGLTEVQIRKFLAMLRRNPSIAGIFTLPNEKMFKRVYNARIKPILDKDTVFNPPMAINPVRRMDLVQIFDSFGYITGCTEGDATSISADFLFHDELDLSPMDMIGLFQSRLQNSDLKMTQAFSTPSFLDFGINRSYQLTDQREYMIKCASCNEWQVPLFEFDFVHLPDSRFDVEKITHLTEGQIADIAIDQTYVKCKRCSARLDLNDAEAREWVPTYPTRTAARGYKVRPFSTARITPAYILQQLSKYQQQDYMRGFYNTVLGEPFTESSAQLQRHEIEACMAARGDVPNIGKDRPVFLGVDFGQICHIVLHTENDKGHPEFVLFEQVPVYQIHERISDLRETYSIVQGCSDRYPYTPDAELIRDVSGGTIQPIHYGGRAHIAPHTDEMGTFDYYTANRTSALDRVRTVIVNQLAVLSGYGPYRETLITHLRDMVRDEKPEAEPEWKKLNGNDHFFHAMALSLLARRVCDHMYTHASQSLLTTALVSSVRMPGATGALNYARGAERISRLGK